MGHISRKYARESKRSHGLMQQHQPPGAYKEGEKRYKEAQAKKRDERAAMMVTSTFKLGKRP